MLLRFWARPRFWRDIDTTVAGILVRVEIRETLLDGPQLFLARYAFACDLLLGFRRSQVAALVGNLGQVIAVARSAPIEPRGQNWFLRLVDALAPTKLLELETAFDGPRRAFFVSARADPNRRRNVVFLSSWMARAAAPHIILDLASAQEMLDAIREAAKKLEIAVPSAPRS